MLYIVVSIKAKLVVEYSLTNMVHMGILRHKRIVIAEYMGDEKHTNIMYTTS